MTLPLLLDLGFSNADIGRVQQGLGLAISIIGAFVGGGLIATDLEPQMKNVNASLYLRIPFSVSNVNGLDSLSL